MRDLARVLWIIVIVPEVRAVHLLHSGSTFVVAHRESSSSIGELGTMADCLQHEHQMKHYVLRRTATKMTGEHAHGLIRR